ncbi:MAG: hypothetical protein IT444_09385 [Phycisphaeraceae bacterium]|nr:hypothetical protein [Phycisphaeraceae bacterium]
MNLHYVTYSEPSGLANRLRLHCLAHAYALKTGRKLVTNWKRNSHCFATYRDLFVGGPSELGELQKCEQFYFRLVRRFRRSTFENGNLPDGKGVEWLPDLPEALVDISNVKANTGTGSRLGSYHSQVIANLEPLPEIKEAAADFLGKFQAPLIGIHVRLGDFVKKYQESLPPMDRYVAMLRHISAVRPAAVFILVSDGDEQFLAPLLATGRCHMRPKKNTRSTVDGIKDALTDLWMLASTDLVIGTPYSSFSGFAAMMRNKPILRASADWMMKVDAALTPGMTFQTRPG